MITITLNKILEKNPCSNGWVKILHARGKITEQQMQEVLDGGCVPKSYSKLADDEAFPLALALESNGLDDVLWSLRCLPDDRRLWRKYAVWCARQVQHLMRDKRSINALDVAWRHSDGLATDEELSAARRSAYAADADAAAYAAAAYAEAAAAYAYAYAADADAAAYAAAAYAEAAAAYAYAADADAAAYAEAAAYAAAAYAADTRDKSREAQKDKLLQILEAGQWVD